MEQEYRDSVVSLRDLVDEMNVQRAIVPSFRWWHSGHIVGEVLVDLAFESIPIESMGPVFGYVCDIGTRGAIEPFWSVNIERWAKLRGSEPSVLDELPVDADLVRTSLRVGV